MALDLTVEDPDDGMEWDFSNSNKRDKAERMIEGGKAMLIIGSPMCSALKQLQREECGEDMEAVKEKKLEEVKRHLEFCCKLYRMQMERGMYFIHEHPKKALSWEEHSVKALLRDFRVKLIEGDICMTGAGKGKTSFMTNASGIATRLSRRCKKIQRTIHSKSEEEKNRSTCR